MNTKKLVYESLGEFITANNMNPVDKFSIQNDLDFKEMQEILIDEGGIDPVPQLKDILGDVYFIGHSENDVTPGTSERIEVVYELTDSNKYTNLIEVKSTQDDMESFNLFIHEVDGLTLVDLNDGYTSGWFTNAEGMSKILDLANQS